MNELALFAGSGGGILGGKLLGWKTVCAVEINKYAVSVLLQRQNDKILDPFPIWDDITTFNGTRWRGFVDVVSGGFPCQDISAAGKGVGITGTRSGLWKQMARIIDEVQPRFCFIENSPYLVRRGLGVVLSDLAKMGYDAKWGVVSAQECGANHKRERIWILANANGTERQKDKQYNYKIDGRFKQLFRQNAKIYTKFHHDQRTGKKVFRLYDQSIVDGIINDIPFGMDRIKAIGNAQVPIVAATAFSRLMEL